MKHLNPRQGITSSDQSTDYRALRRRCVKHLNPRQGITRNALCGSSDRRQSTCETPKSPPGDYKLEQPEQFFTQGVPDGVKHLNPRQGITSQRDLPRSAVAPFCVKHLNPRQGITRFFTQGVPDAGDHLCETPKSPPGDYNQSTAKPRAARTSRKCETPKSPPGDYNGGC